ncbi:MAG: hypothetical protein WCA63_05675 [Gallionella sp.]
MKFLRLMLIVFAIGFSSDSNAVAYMGVTSCEEWVNRHSTNDSSMEEWILGYLSGLAAANNIDLLKGAQRKSLFSWMDNYCQKNPLKRIDSGAHDLALELIKRMNK